MKKPRHLWSHLRASFSPRLLGAGLRAGWPKCAKRPDEQSFTHSAPPQQT